MTFRLSQDEKRRIQRIANEPYLWLRKHYTESKEWEDELYDLIDSLKIIWEQSQPNRTPLCFALTLKIADKRVDSLSIHDYIQLQKKQIATPSTVFVIDLKGIVTDQADLGDEIEPLSAKQLSQLREIVVFWLGPELKIYCRGYTWEPRNKREILKDIKSKRRDRLLPMQNHRKVLEEHFEQCVRGQRSIVYWFPGKKNKVLRPQPEQIFQKSLCNFLNREVDCLQADMEPMFDDGSRCDVRVFTDNYDLYFIEIKWIGYCAKKIYGTAKYTAEDGETTEMDTTYAIGGAYQTKLYVKNNNSEENHHRIKLGIYLVYDAYPEPVTPLEYGEKIDDYPLLETIEFSLIHTPPSRKGPEIAKQEGAI
jgi:hypothetical protein